MRALRSLGAGRRTRHAALATRQAPRHCCRDRGTRTGRLVPLAADRCGTALCRRRADLAAAMRSRDEARWAPLLGGQWLAAEDRAGSLACSATATVPSGSLFSKGYPARDPRLERTGFVNAAERAAIEAGTEPRRWCAGRQAAMADNWRRRRQSGDRPILRADSVQHPGDTPLWRAFIEQPSA